MNAALIHQVTMIIVDQLGVDIKEVTPKASFFNDLGAGSLDRIEMLIACEEAFRIEIPDDDAMGILRVKDLFAYLDRRGIQAA